MDQIHRKITFLTTLSEPQLEVIGPYGSPLYFPFQIEGEGRFAHEKRWVADIELAADRAWRFRILEGEMVVLEPKEEDFFPLSQEALWIQDGQLFTYRPAPNLSDSTVIKVSSFHGSLPDRPLYVYLPRGYHEQPQLFYPVIYMQDGQNCFEAFVDDSYAGSWQADLVADLLIQDGLMHECIIVGVGHGGSDRIVEYLPPYATFPPRNSGDGDGPHQQDISRVGRADETVAYYIDDVHAYVCSNFRALRRRDYIALCGSSMGGLFALFAAWHAPEFAQQVAALSTSFWITQEGENRYSMIEKMRQPPALPLRVWLDSGTQASPGSGDDGQDETLLAKETLQAAGFVEGDNLGYFLDVGATHSERAWAKRLDKIFKFLFPT